MWDHVSTNATENLIVGDVENLRIMINTGVCEKMKRCAETYEINEAEDVLWKYDRLH